MTPEQRAIIQHSLGVDAQGNGTQNRNHFVTEETSTDGVICEQLVQSELMSKSRGNAVTGGMPVYRVTDAGRRMFFTSIGKPPKKTRAQLRYLEWRDADSGLTFFEWLKSRKKVTA